MSLAPIDNQHDLAELVASLRAQAWIALDTEFMRERTYFARLCLIQVATPARVACIDPLADLDLGPLLDVLYAPHTLKVLHAARQDLEVFADLRGAPPGPIFDTQIAAAYLGHDEQIGYAPLVESLTGVVLDKTHTRTDWARRPLSPEQTRYAEDDVRHLCSVYEQLRERLAALGRLDWVEEECARLTDPNLYRNPPELAWRRFKHGHHLNPAQQQVLRELAEWRERTAQEKNLPRAWILRDPVMMDIARARPATSDALAQIRSLDEKARRRWGDHILEVLARARQHPAQRVWATPSPLSPDQARLCKRLAETLDSVAQSQQLAPIVLGSRRDLQALVLGERNSALLSGWRRQLVGERLLALLDAAQSPELS